MKEETRLRLQIREAEKIQESANDPGDKIMAARLEAELKMKLLKLKYPNPKEL